MDASVKKIYADAMILQDLKALVRESARMRQGALISRAWNTASQKLEGFIRRLSEISTEDAGHILAVWRETAEGECDHRALAAKTESMLMPELRRCIRRMYGIAVSNVGKWEISSSECGFFTIKDTVSNRFLHSPNDPMQEAEILAEELFAETMEEYHIFGCGLGYLPYQIWKASEYSARIYVYEDTAEMIALATEIGVLDWIDPKYLTMVHENKIDSLLEKFISNHPMQERGVYICDWKNEAFTGSKYENDIQTLELNGRTNLLFSRITKINVRENRKLITYPVEQLKEEIGRLERYEAAVVSAGPSLSEAIPYLKRNREKMVLIAVNSALPRLIKEAIRPDLVVMLDPNYSLKDHVEAIVEKIKGVPLLTVMTGSYSFLKIYPGKIYMLPMEEKECESEYHWNFAGTVTSLALDASYYFDIKTVYLIGSDLSFPNGENYAAGVAHDVKEGMSHNQEDGLTVEAVDGSRVATCRQYNYYRGILEAQIAEHPGIYVYNMSSHGARIRGTMLLEAQTRDSRSEAESDFIFKENQRAWAMRYRELNFGKPELWGKRRRAEYDAIFAATPSKNDISGIPEDVKICFFIGFSDGSYLREVLKKSPEMIKIMIYEPDADCFSYVCSRADISDIILDKRVTIVLGKDNLRVDMKQAIIQSVDLMSVRHMFSRIVPGYSERYAGALEELVTAVKDFAMPQAVDDNTALLYSRIRIKNQLYALAQLPSSSLSVDLFSRIADKDTTIILVGAGPSLEKNASRLKQAKGKAIIVACTRSLEILEKNGVSPDILAMIDMVEGHNYCVQDSEKKYHILFFAQSAADIQKEYKGKGIYFGFPYWMSEIGRLADEIYDLPTGGSVVTCIFSLFLRAGFRNFILVGEDLAYDDDGRAHSGTFKDTAKETKDMYTDGIFGGKVRTREEWTIFRTFFEDYISLYDDLDIIDASEGGALIHGSRVMTLEDAINGIDGNAVSLNKVLETLPRGNITDKEEVIRLYDKLDKLFGNLQIAFGDAISYNDQIRGVIKSGKTVGSYYDTICKAYEEIYQRIVLSEEEDFLKDYCKDVFFAYADKVQFLDKKDVIAKLEAESRLFEDLRNAGSDLRASISEYRSQLEGEMTDGS